MAIIPPGQFLAPREPAPERPAPTPESRSEGTGTRFPSKRVLRAFINKSMAHLRPSESTVWLALFGWVVPETGEVTMPIERIAGLTGRSAATVKRSLRRLRELGLVTVLHRGNNIYHLPSVYRLRGLTRGPGGGEVTGEPLICNTTSSQASPFSSDKPAA
jgi:hypothetical protein